MHLYRSRHLARSIARRQGHQTLDAAAVMGNEKSRHASKTPTVVVEPKTVKVEVESQADDDPDAPVSWMLGEPKPEPTAPAKKAGAVLQRKASVVRMVKSSSGSGIPIQSLSPDADGNGTIELEEFKELVAENKLPGF